MGLMADQGPYRSIQGSILGWGSRRTVTVVPWGKLAVEHCLATRVMGASFEIVTFVVRNGSLLVRNIS